MTIKLQDFHGPWPLWINLGVVIAVILVQVQVWRFWIRLFVKRPESGKDTFATMWWPPGKKNLILYLTAGFYLMNCFDHPPLGTDAGAAIVNWMTAIACVVRYHID